MDLKDLSHFGSGIFSSRPLRMCFRMTAHIVHTFVNIAVCFCFLFLASKFCFFYRILGLALELSYYEVFCVGF
jgi:hypothetical protein